MKVILHGRFIKQYHKLKAGEQKKLSERRDLFLADPYNQLLNNHPLSGKYEGYRSINITGDVRVIYKLLRKDTAIFVKIGSHSELYK